MTILANCNIVNEQKTLYYCIALHPYFNSINEYFIMCMLFIKPKNLILPANYHESLWDKNSDGLSVWNKSTKSLFKTLCKNEAYNYLLNNAESEVIVHYRFGTSDLSDTQNLVNYFNQNNFDLYEVIKYLEKYEYNSRFLIIDKTTNEVIKPNCAKWNDITLIDGYEVRFSNNYAIDCNLLGFDDWYFNEYDDSYDMLDNPDFAELDYIINSCSEKDLIDFIQCNPETVAQYLKELNRAF